jgi:hypothetical protein
MNITTPLNDPDMKLEIMRLDGLLIEDSRLSDYEAIAPGDFFGSIAYTISMTPLLLGWGIYVTTCKLLDNNEVIAVKSTIVEVIDPNPPTRGRPAIIYTYQSEVKGHHTIA